MSTAPESDLLALLGLDDHADLLADPRVLAVDLLLAELARDVDAALGDPAARERVAAVLWYLGFARVEPDPDALAWMRARGLEVAIQPIEREPDLTPEEVETVTPRRWMDLTWKSRVRALATGTESLYLDAPSPAATGADEVGMHRRVRVGSSTARII